MKKKLFVLCMFFSPLSIVSFAYSVSAPHIITFFFSPANSAIKKEFNLEKPIKNIHRTDKLLKQVITKDVSLHLKSGIYAINFGNSAVSDVHGQVTFERKITEPKIKLLVTENIKPIPVSPYIPNTITGFVLNPKAKYQYYELNRSFDKDTKVYTWNTKKIDISPKSKISPDTIIIFADPKHIIVPTGSTRTMSGENLLLPDVYVTKNTNSAFYALNFFKIRKFFAPVKMKDEFKESYIAQKIA